MDVFLLFLVFIIGCVFGDEPTADRFLWNGHVSLEGGLSRNSNDTTGEDEIVGEARVKVGVHYDDKGDDKGIFSDFINKFVESTQKTPADVAQDDDGATLNRVGNTAARINRNCADVQLMIGYLNGLLRKQGIIRDDLKIVNVGGGGGGCSAGFVNAANAVVIKSLKMLVDSNHRQTPKPAVNVTVIVSEADKTVNVIKALLQNIDCHSIVSCQQNKQKNTIAIINGHLEYINRICGGCLSSTQIFFEKHCRELELLAIMARLIRGDQIAWTQTNTLGALKALVGVQTAKVTTTLTGNLRKMSEKDENTKSDGAKVPLITPVKTNEHVENKTENGTTLSPP